MVILRLVLLVALLIAMFITGAASAGPYFSGGYVSSEMKPDSTELSGFDDTASGFTARFGWEFSQWMTLEADYTDYGETEKTINYEQGTLRKTYSGQSLGAFVTLGNARMLKLYNVKDGESFGTTLNLGAYARFGVMAARVKTNIGNNYGATGRENSLDVDDDDIGYGAGIGVVASYYPVGVFIEYNMVNVPINYGVESGTFDPRYWLLGLQVSF